jgi:hypothetical protein
VPHRVLHRGLRNGVIPVTKVPVIRQGPRSG